MNYIYDPQKTSKYVYDPYLEHFDFKLPFKLDFPKLPKTPNLPKLPDIQKQGKQLSKTLSNVLGGKKDREWKKHKWKDRKRDKNGKWIYDYGDGFPDEKKKKSKKKKNMTDGAAGYLSDIHKYLSATGQENNDLIPLGWSKFAFDPEVLKTDKKIGGDPVSRFLAAASNFKGMSNPLYAIQRGQAFIADLDSIGRRRSAKQAKQNSKTDPKTGLKLKRKQTSAEDDLQKTNPNYNTSGGAGNNNCYACSLAYDLRRRGYEVTAPLDADGGLAGNVVNCYKNGKPIYVTSDDPVGSTHTVGQNKGLSKAVQKQLSTEPDNTRGIAWMKWDNGTGVNGGGGHVVAYEKHNGKTTFYDAQTREKVEIPEYIDEASAFMYMRTDNLEVNYDNVKKIVDYE